MNKKDEMIIMCTVEFQISDFLLMEFDLKVMLNLKSSDHCTIILIYAVCMYKFIDKCNA